LLLSVLGLALGRVLPLGFLEFVDGLPRSDRAALMLEKCAGWRGDGGGRKVES